MTELKSPKSGVVACKAGVQRAISFELSKPDLQALKPPAQGSESSQKKSPDPVRTGSLPLCRGCSAKLSQKQGFLTSGLPGLWFAFLAVSAAGSFSAEQFVATEISQGSGLAFYIHCGKEPLGGGFATLISPPTPPHSHHSAGMQACTGAHALL